MNDISNSLVRLNTASKGLLHFLGKHRILIVIIISSAAIVFALFETRSYLNPGRDESIYTELSTGINYSGIDQDTVEKLRSTQNDQEILVDSNFVPDRNNPFSE